MPNILTSILLWMRRLAVLFLVFSVVSVVLYKFIPPPVTPLMLMRLGEQNRNEQQQMRLYKDWVSLEDISPHMPLAAVSAEDQKLLEHHGFDFVAMKKAYAFNKHSKRTRGASTISQQTAKNVFLWPSRSIFRKLIEAYFTVLIEAVWGKKRIMEVYLNVAEWGNGIYGVEAASQTYFGKSAARLTREEAALLAAVLPGPLKYSVRNPSNYIKNRQRRILNQMRNWSGGIVNFDHPNTPGVLPHEEETDEEKE